MTIKVIILLASILIIGAPSYYYVDVDTLMFSEIVGETNDPKVSIFVNLFDFDTGLTRYDIYNLSKNNDYWRDRILKVHAIQNPQLREVENEKLMAEMMKDPTMKKIARKVLGFGTQTALAFLGAL